MGILGGSLGVPGGSLGSPWGSLGGPWGVLGGPWESLGSPWGPPSVFVGPPGATGGMGGVPDMVFRPDLGGGPVRYAPPLKRGAADLIASRIPPGQIRYMNEDPKMHRVEKAGGLSLGRLGAGWFWEFCCGFS